MENILEVTNVSLRNNIMNNLFQFIEFFPTGILVLDESLLIIDANKLGMMMIGIEKEKIIGRNITKFIVENDLDQFNKFFLKALLTSIPQTIEITIRKPDSSGLNILAMLRTFDDTVVNKKLCVLAIIDFTPQKMKEEIIRDSEARFKNMANTAPVMIWIADVEGLFSFVNKIWLDYTGGEIGNQLGVNWLKNVHPEDFDYLLKNYQKAISTQESFTIEFRFMGNNKTYEWMLLKGKPRFSVENVFVGFIGSCFSINDQKEIEAKVSKMNEELVEINATKDKFFSIISHDLRSPLGGLKGILEILSEDYNSLDEKEKQEITSEAFLLAKNTYNLIENLLEWSRFQTGRMQYHPERIKLLQIIDNISSLYSQNIKNKEIALAVDIKPDQYVLSDKKMIETILRNLVSNAIKFTYPKGSVTLSSEVDNDFVIIKVRDTGVGISEENLPKLFRLDVSHSTKGTAKESGTGLGLILCKELVEKLGGKLWIESKENEGSAFYFTVPSVK